MYSDCNPNVLRMRRPAKDTKGWTENNPGTSTLQGTAPIFITTKLGDLQKLAWWAADDPHTGGPRSGDASMIMRRLKVYQYHHRIPKPPPHLPFCGRCFAHMIIHGGTPPPYG